MRQKTIIGLFVLTAVFIMVGCLPLRQSRPTANSLNNNSLNPAPSPKGEGNSLNPAPSPRGEGNSLNPDPSPRGEGSKYSSLSELADSFISNDILADSLLTDSLLLANDTTLLSPIS